MNNENDLQRLDQISVSVLSLSLSIVDSLSLFYTVVCDAQFHTFAMQLQKLRPEFRSGLDALTKFVFERTRPKQVGATIMTGPVLVGVTQSYLDALNNGAVPSITSSWQVGVYLYHEFFLN